MTAAELIERLQAVPPDALVTIPDILELGWIAARGARVVTMRPRDRGGNELTMGGTAGPPVEVVILE